MACIGALDLVLYSKGNTRHSKRDCELERRRIRMPFEMLGDSARKGDDNRSQAHLMGPSRSREPRVRALNPSTLVHASDDTR